MNTINIRLRLTKLYTILFLLSISISSLQAVDTVASTNKVKVYSEYDTDKNGYLEEIEYKKFFGSKQKRSKNMQLWLFNTVDANKDGQISEQEMVNAIMKNFKIKNK
jgi:Ca2+-binding EF-hand superfamily protein